MKNCVQTTGKMKLEEHITEKRYTRQQRNNTRPTVEANSENGLTDTDTTSRKNVEQKSSKWKNCTTDKQTDIDIATRKALIKSTPQKIAITKAPKIGPIQPKPINTSSDVEQNNTGWWFGT